MATFTVAFDTAQDKELFLSECGIAIFNVAFDKAQDKVILE